MWYFKQYRVVTFRLLQNFEVELNASHSKRSHFLITIQPGLYNTVSYDYIMISTTLTKIELMSDLMVIVCLPWVPWEEGLSYVAGAMHNQMSIHDDCHRLYRQHPNALCKCRLNIWTLVECSFLGPKLPVRIDSVSEPAYYHALRCRITLGCKVISRHIADNRTRYVFFRYFSLLLFTNDALQFSWADGVNENGRRDLQASCNPFCVIWVVFR